VAAGLPSFAVTKGPLDDELDPPDKKPCPGGYELVNDPGNPYDVNGNGFLCEKKGGPGPRKEQGFLGQPLRPGVRETCRKTRNGLTAAPRTR
jgi:hypothetical protein